jgi:hypothetical protein
MRKQIYEYRVIGHLNVGSKKNPEWDSEIINSGEILAANLKEAEFFVHRKVDEEEIETFGLENIEIVIRPFVNSNHSTWSPSTISYGSTTGARWNPSAPSYHTGPQFTTTGVNDSINVVNRTITI